MDSAEVRWFHLAVQAPRLPPRTLVHLMLGAALLRGVALGAHPLWLDEGATWSWATAPTWGDTVLAEANHPPAWWIVTRLWIGAFGDSEAALRAPAAILGVLTVLLAWLLATRLLDPRRLPRRGGFRAPPEDVARTSRRTALWFTGFIALSTYMTEYAQEARMYAALIAEGLGLSLLYLAWLDTGRRRSAVGYALLGALALYTHYFALWILAAHGAHLLYLRWRSRSDATPLRIAPLVWAHIAAGVLFVPWLVYMAGAYESISTGDPYEPFGRLGYVIWRMGVGPGLVVVDRTRQVAGIGATIHDELGWIVLTAALWVPALVLGIRALRRRPGTASFVAFQLLVPIACVLAIFPKFQLIHERYLVFLGAFVLLLASLGAREGPRLLRPLITGSLVVLLGLGLVAYHGASVGLTPEGRAGTLGRTPVPSRLGAAPDDMLSFLHHGHPYGKEPWRQAQAFVAEHAQADDLVLLHPGYLHLVWDYYDRGRLERIRLPREAMSVEAFRQAHASEIADRERVFLVLAHEETDDPDAYVEVVRRALFETWSRQAIAERNTVSFQVAGPLLFDRSWGVRVAVFNRRAAPPAETDR